MTGKSSGGRTVAIVDAYGYTDLERDLGVYRSQFGLPACTKASGCLKVVNQTGGTSLPRTDLGWDASRPSTSMRCPRSARTATS